MKRLIFLILPLLLSIMTSGSSKGGVKDVGSKTSWPSEVAGWRWDGREFIYNPDTIFDYIDGAGELYRSYNFISLTVRNFTRKGHPQITAEIYNMGSSKDAYGIFSFEREDEDAGIGQGSEYGGGLLRFWKGIYFVMVYAEGEGPDIPSAILEIGRAIAGSIKEKGEPPAIVSFLPGKEKGLVERAIRYFHNHHTMNRKFFVASENILQLGKDTEGVIAPYVDGGVKFHLLLIQYRDEEKAKMALKSFLKAYMPEAANKGILKTEDRKWTMAKRAMDLIIIVFGSPTEEKAQDMIRSVIERAGKGP